MTGSLAALLDLSGFSLARPSYSVLPVTGGQSSASFNYTLSGITGYLRDGEEFRTPVVSALDCYTEKSPCAPLIGTRLTGRDKILYNNQQ